MEPGTVLGGFSGTNYTEVTILAGNIVLDFVNVITAYKKLCWT